VLNNLHTLAITHRQFEVEKIGLFHIPVDQQDLRLNHIKNKFGFQELLYLTTCNRVEFSFVTPEAVDNTLLYNLLKELSPAMSADALTNCVINLEKFRGMKAIEHAMSVASSIDSMVIGEREIITQVRLAYEQCFTWGLTGDLFRILNRHVIETAKEVYTKTSIATKPVSVVSLAYQQLKQMNIPLDATILIIGAGVTNTTMSRFLMKHGFKKFVVFNRSIEKAQTLANDLRGMAYPLTELKTYQGGFDVIITCTGAEHHVITPEIYESILQGDTKPKTIIDIAIPQDLDPIIPQMHAVKHISVSMLQKISNQNLKERSKELAHVERILGKAKVNFEKLLHERQVELAMKEIPEEVKKIKSIALNEVFKEDINHLDDHSKEVLEKILGYMEKKYIAGPMKMAKEILIKNG
jgi:glutamyl-tRNA reductase